MLSPLNFPPPHQLSRGSHRRSFVYPTSRNVKTASSISRSAPSHADARSSPPLSRSHTVSGSDETDSGPPPTKRLKLPKLDKSAQPIVTSFGGKPLKSLSLYLPSRLPASILREKSALARYTLATTATYLTLWRLDRALDAVDVRLPTEYSNCLCDDSTFIPAFLKTVFDGLQSVKSIKEIYLPKVTIQDTSCSAIIDIFQIFSAASFSIKQAFLTLSFATDKSSLSSLAFTRIAKIMITKSSVKEVTFVSSSDMLPQFSERLHTAITKVGKSGIKFTTLTEDTSAPPGPVYLTDSDKSEATGEEVDPHTLLSSLNSADDSKYALHSGEEDGGRPSHSLHKGILKRAFTTDCSYSIEACLSSDNTYASQVWDLERLHANEIDGTGTTIAILDSGINYMSPAFKDKIIAIRNFVPGTIDDVDCAIDSDGHGSLCAGIAASSSFYCPINPADPTSPCLKIPPGVAPGAKLIICKVIDTTSGDVNTTAFIEALKWLKEIHTSGIPVDVVSISLASSYFSHKRAKVIGDLINLGVIVVCCASNVGRMKMQPISYPARLGNVLCIGAHDTNGKPTSFSPVGRELDFLAPGDDIWGPGPGTIGPFAMDCGSGTSCSTPAVAGLVCLILHLVRERCTEESDVDTTIAGKPLTHYVKSVHVMRELLKEMSSSPGHHSEEMGYGTLNPYRLLDCNTEELVRIINDIIEDE